jgi:phage shock protein A
MKKIVLCMTLSYATIFANDVTIVDIGKAVEKIYANQVLLEKKLIDAEKLLKSYKQQIDDLNNLSKKLEHNDNILNTNILKLESLVLQLKEEKKSQSIKLYKVKVNAANIRQTPSLNGKIKNIVYQDRELTSSNQTHEWVYIDDLDGWIHKNTIEEIQQGEQL